VREAGLPSELEANAKGMVFEFWTNFFPGKVTTIMINLSLVTQLFL